MARVCCAGCSPTTTRIARVAAEALGIIHVDPTTGEEQEGACVRGCYRCLLSYSNQLVHEHIDRRLVIERLQALATRHYPGADACDYQLCRT